MRLDWPLLPALLLFGCLPPARVEPPAPAAVESSPAPERTPAPEPFTGPELAEGQDGCTLEFSGIASGKAMGGGGVDSDHFYSEAELRQRLAGADDEVIEQAMRNDPHWHLLILNCTTEQVRISFKPGSAMKYADLPFGPGTYTLGVSESKIGGSVRLDAGELTSLEIEAGTLEITRFDGSGIAGRFVVHAIDPYASSTVDVTGSFSFPCVQGTAICGGPRAVEN
jgi:hypothetical protein